MHVLEVTFSSEENVQESSGGNPAGPAVSLDRWFEALCDLLSVCEMCT